MTTKQIIRYEKMTKTILQNAIQSSREATLSQKNQGREWDGKERILKTWRETRHTVENALGMCSTHLR